MNHQILQQYIDKQCTPQLRKEIFAYLKTLSPQQLQAFLLENDVTVTQPMPAAAAAKLDEYVNALQAKDRAHKITSINLWRYWKVACCILLIAGLFSILKLSVKPGKQVAEVQYQMVSNPSDQIKKITLADGSQVWLTPQSALQVPLNFSSNRQLTLQGEAYFEVAHNKALPFIVNTNDVQTTVLGTHFNIESYSGETDTRVSLTNGSIAVKYAQPNGKDSTILLTPGKRLIYQRNTHLANSETFNSQNESDWKAGAIVLNNVPVRDAFNRLQQRFGKTIKYDTAMFAHRRFTGTYPNAGLRLILNNMAFVQGLTYSISGDSININSAARTAK